MTRLEYDTLSTHLKLTFLRSCTGVHSSLENLFECDVCSFMLEDAENQATLAKIKEAK